MKIKDLEKITCECFAYVWLLKNDGAKMLMSLSYPKNKSLKKYVPNLDVFHKAIAMRDAKGVQITLDVLKKICEEEEIKFIEQSKEMWITHTSKQAYYERNKERWVAEFMRSCNIS